MYPLILLRRQRHVHTVHVGFQELPLPPVPSRNNQRFPHSAVKLHPRAPRSRLVGPTTSDGRFTRHASSSYGQVSSPTTLIFLRLLSRSLRVLLLLFPLSFIYISPLFLSQFKLETPLTEHTKSSNLSLRWWCPCSAPSKLSAPSHLSVRSWASRLGPAGAFRTEIKMSPPLWRGNGRNRQALLRRRKMLGDGRRRTNRKSGQDSRQSWTVSTASRPLFPTDPSPPRGTPVMLFGRWLDDDRFLCNCNWIEIIQYRRWILLSFDFWVVFHASLSLESRSETYVGTCSHLFRCAIWVESCWSKGRS